MRVVGLLAVGFGAIVAAVGAVVGIRSVPDIKRYLKMRKM